jgi:hypothetical protein
LIILTDEFLEGSAVSVLSLPDEERIVDAASLRSHLAPG